MRDHSWGIRSSMGVPTKLSGTDRTDEESFNRALRLWVPFEAGDHTGFVNTHEDPDGRPLDFEGRLDWPDGRSVALTGMSHELTYLPGTQWPTGGTIVLDGEDGVARKYELRLAGTPADVQAGGYYRGWRDGLGPGVYRGAEVQEIDDYDVTPGGERTGPPHVPVRHRLGPHRVPHAHGRSRRRGRDGALRAQHPRRIPSLRVGLSHGSRGPAAPRRRVRGLRLERDPPRGRRRGGAPVGDGRTAPRRRRCRAHRRRGHRRCQCTCGPRAG